MARKPLSAQVLQVPMIAWAVRHRKLGGLVAAAAVLVYLVLLPWMVSSYWSRVMTTVIMMAILAEAWNLITGFVGYPAFGNVAFFGVGAYTVGVISTRVEVPYVLSLLAAAAVSAVICALLGSPLMRVRGHYFAIGTIGLAAAFREGTYLIPQLTTSASGTIILPGFASGVLTIQASAYYWMFGTLLLCVAAAIYVDRSRFGYGLKAIRADETVASTFGVPTFRYKLTAWMISAAFSSVAGGIWATWIGVIDPVNSYNLALAVSYSVIALVGGLGTVLGPLIGAVLIGIVGEVVWSQYSTLHLLVMGVIIMVTSITLPDGLMGIFSRRRDRGTPIAPARYRRDEQGAPKSILSAKGDADA